MTDDKTEMEIKRGQDAAQLLAHPLLVGAFETIETEIVSKWQNSPARDAEGREKLWMMLHLLRRVKLHLESHVETGKVAQATLAQKAAQAIGMNSTPF
jgi:hypothetical protein